MNWVLASQSPRRRMLLEEAGVSFRQLSIEVDESLDAPLPPQQTVEVLAARKALAGRSVVAGQALTSEAPNETWVIGSDTVVAISAEVLGKPRDAAHAHEMLSKLSGSQHEVWTGVALCRVGDNHLICRSDVTAITMRTMSAAEIAAYVASGESEGKAGAYAIQESGDAFVTHRDGSWSNVVGLPIDLTMAMMQTAALTPCESASDQEPASGA